MSAKVSILQTLTFFFYRFVLRRNPKPKHQRCYSSLQREDISNHTFIFNLEGALLKSESLFPYFMLVAFEAGGVIRSFILLMLYPLICTMRYEMGMKVMVMVSFFGVKSESFRVGKAVLPKFFLEDVGLEMFEVLRRAGKRICVSDLPQVMIEGFLKDYMDIEVVIGREMKEFCGYFVGTMEDKKKYYDVSVEECLRQERLSGGNVIGITSFNKSIHHPLFSRCLEVYFVKSGTKRNWQTLPRDKYPKPLIFHDGRLVTRPTPLTTLVLFMWAPMAVVVVMARGVIGLTLPYPAATPLLAFSGFRLTLTVNALALSSRYKNNRKGCLFVCNHRTLFDPLYLSFALKKKKLTAVTYSLSRVSEILAPIRTMRLSRDRKRDGEMMDRLLKQGDLVVCPEGTTCREPYLLRFSPLFAEISDVIIPVAVNSHVTFFHGTTASGLKAFDPLFFLMDPFPSYTVRLLDPVPGLSTCRHHEEREKFEVANRVQSVMGKALGFECTNFTRRDKYLILAGNNGLVTKN
ncbi:PREDICTED: probable glycerol-3-phosphate acyltransferase 3 [Tarenaya hassleriana]|uniref:probable glycerol-3-phosphate acyltransferase 3 n=1 Tax=Tarenaya hassleriana TaxID=28532 RepID=UPI00053C7D8C|nr:PREDICTED: probable glycerol-3-phosphate acyltransferase 3 [Tarenaya hassleriana]